MNPKELLMNKVIIEKSHNIKHLQESQNLFSCDSVWWNSKNAQTGFHRNL